MLLRRCQYTNFETLNISHTDAGCWRYFTDRSQDVSLVAGVTSIGLTTYALTGTTSDDGDTATAVGFTNMGAGVTAMSISGLSYTGGNNSNDDDVALTLTASRAANTSADSLTVTMGTATAAAGNSSAATATDALTLNVTLNNEETIGLVSQGGANTITTLAARIKDFEHFWFKSNDNQKSQ